MRKAKGVARGEGQGPGRVQRLEGLLRYHGAQLLESRHRLRDDLPAVAADVRDSVEESVDQFARGLGAALAELSYRTVRGIESALQRVETGAYGLCVDCDAAIPPARLEALPFAVRCRGCQEARDGAEASVPLLA
jgi:DnaK suppressor protein